jgi:hypothetical protein
MAHSYPACNLCFRHLAPDAQAAGVGYPELERNGVSAEELRRLIESLAGLAPRVESPVVPELRIATAGRQYLVQVKAGRICFSSWSVRVGGK